MHVDPTDWRDWRRIAEKDWRRVHLGLDHDDIELAAFYLQQSVEKYLKGLLLQRGHQPRKIHYLPDLLKTAATIDPTFSTHLQTCARITQYYMLTRYSTGLPPDSETAVALRADIAAAKRLIDHICNLLDALDEHTER